MKAVFFCWATLIIHSKLIAALSLGTTLTISSSSGGGNSLPQVTINTNDRALSIWQKLFVNQVEAATLQGTTASAPIILATGNSPQVGIDQNGNGLAVFVNATSQIAVSRFNVLTGAWSTPVQITSSGTNSVPKLSMNATGHAVIVWQVFPSTVQIVEITSGVGTIFTLSSTGVNPQVSINNNGAGFAVWQNISNGLIQSINLTAN